MDNMDDEFEKLKLELEAENLTDEELRASLSDEEKAEEQETNALIEKVEKLVTHMELNRIGMEQLDAKEEDRTLSEFKDREDKYNSVLDRELRGGGEQEINAYTKIWLTVIKFNRDKKKMEQKIDNIKDNVSKIRQKVLYTRQLTKQKKMLRNLLISLKNIEKIMTKEEKYIAIENGKQQINIRKSHPQGGNHSKFGASVGGKKKSKIRKVRKHKAIHQSGGNKGRLKKGYKYSGKKLKSGLPQIIRCKNMRHI